MRNELLDDREGRYEKTLDLIQLFGLPVLCGKLNYPGNNKNTNEAKAAFTSLLDALTDCYYSTTVYSELLTGQDGSAILMALNLEIAAAKSEAIKLEETHPLGRLFDIDVYDGNGRPMSRGSLGYPPRGCILCGNSVSVAACSRLQRHELDEILNEVNRRILAND